MAAYVIVIREGPVHHEAELAEYNRQVMAGPRFPMKPLALYGPLEALEGQTPDGVVILEFEDIEAARNWYFSSEYQKAAEHRKNAAPYRVILVEGP